MHQQEHYHLTSTGIGAIASADHTWVGPFPTHAATMDLARQFARAMDTHESVTETEEGVRLKMGDRGCGEDEWATISSIACTNAGCKLPVKSP